MTKFKACLFLITIFTLSACQKDDLINEIDENKQLESTISSKQFKGGGAEKL